jgi:hypothetical protein
MTEGSNQIFARGSVAGTQKVLAGFEVAVDELLA